MFSKKILVLKQTAEGYSSGTKPLCGICRLEKENDVLTVFLSLIGFVALTSGEYRLYIVGDDKTLIQHPLGKIPVSTTVPFRNNINLGKGVSVGIWAVKNDVPLLVAYQKSDDSRLSPKDYDGAVINDIIAERKNREREKEFVIAEPFVNEQSELQAAEKTKTDETGDTLAPIIAAYNDEAVATENFYDEDRAIKQKLDCIKELSDDYVRRESDGNHCFRPQKTEKSQEDFDFSENETDSVGGENLPYYLSVKNELDGIFDKFPAETTLENTFRGSRFAKVFYSDDKYYVVGLIKENQKEKYICYGVPSVYRDTPPKELAGYCSFVPLSVFNLKGDGYFMMFQDAITGKCIKPE